MPPIRARIVTSVLLGEFLVRCAQKLYLSIFARVPSNVGALVTSIIDIYKVVDGVPWPRIDQHTMRIHICDPNHRYNGRNLRKHGCVLRSYARTTAVTAVAVSQLKIFRPIKFLKVKYFTNQIP